MARKPQAIFGEIGLQVFDGPEMEDAAEVITGTGADVIQCPKQARRLANWLLRWADWREQKDRKK